MKSRAYKFQIAPFVFMAGCVLTVLGLKLALIRQFGSDVPFWDQWNAEGGGLYQAIFDGDWFGVEWFSAHNEHRIFLSRLLAAILVLVNGQWSVFLQTLVNSIIHSVCAGYIVYLFVVREAIDAKWSLIIGVIVVTGFGGAFGWENTLGGFQSQFYFFLLIGAVLLDMASRVDLLVRPGFLFLLLLAAALSPFTIASGALFVISAACLILCRAVATEPGGARNKLFVLSLIMFAVSAAAIFATPPVPHHAALKAQSFNEFVFFFLRALSWPLPWFGCIVLWLPTCLTLYLLWKDRAARQVSIFGLGLAFSMVLVLNAAAMAYSRGAGGSIGSRYTDVLWMSWLVNTFLLARIFGLGSPCIRWASANIASYSTAYVFAALAALSVSGLNGITGAADRGAMYQVQQRNVAAYVATGDLSHLNGKGLLEIPFPNVEYLQGRLDDPLIRSILPPAVRGGLLKTAPKKGGFFAPGAYFSVPPSPAGTSWGSFGDGGDAYTGEMELGPLHTSSGFLSFYVAGYLGREGLSLQFVNEQTGVAYAVKPDQEAGESWREVRVSVPAGSYVLVAIDTAPGFQGWFAFSDVVQYGRLHDVSMTIIGWWRTVLAVGITLFFSGFFALVTFRKV